MNSQPQPYSFQDRLPTVPWSYVPREKSFTFGTAPIAPVHVNETPLYRLLMERIAKGDLAAARFLLFWDLQHRAVVEQAIAAKEAAEDARTAANERASKNNAPIEARIERLEEARQTLCKEHLVALNDIEQERHKACLESAEKAGLANLSFDSETGPEASKRLRTHTESALAAKLVVHNTLDSVKCFLAPLLETLLTLLTGSFVGLFAFALGGQVHLNALGRNPLVEIAACLFGCSSAFYYGRAIRGTWRYARHQYDLHGKASIPIALAVLLTIAPTIMQATIDQQGLLASADIRDRLASLSGTATAGGSSNWLIYFLVGSYAALGFFLYQGVKGWSDCGAARNLIALSSEESKFSQIQEIEGDPAWSEALVAGNKLLAIAHIQADLRSNYATKLAILEKEIEKLTASLQPIQDIPNESWLAIRRQADTNAEGQQSVWDRMFESLTGSKPHPSSPQYAPKVSWFVALVKRVWTPKGGS